MRQAYISTNYYKPKILFFENYFSEEDLLKGSIDVPEFAKEAYFLNFALNIRTTFEMPVDEIRRINKDKQGDEFIAVRNRLSSNLNDNELWRHLLAAQRRKKEVPLYSFSKPELLLKVTQLLPKLA